jgi:hypothetical protein
MLTLARSHSARKLTLPKKLNSTENQVHAPIFGGVTVGSDFIPHACMLRARSRASTSRRFSISCNLGRAYWSVPRQRSRLPCSGRVGAPTTESWASPRRPSWLLVCLGSRTIYIFRHMLCLGGVTVRESLSPCLGRSSILLILMLIGAVPRWRYSSSWGYGRSGIVGVVLLIDVVLLLLGRL